MLSRIVLFFAFAPAIWADPTGAGRFLIKRFFGGDVYIESLSQTSATAYLFDSRTGVIDYATLSLNSGTGIATSSLNARVVIVVYEQSVDGDWAGLGFTATRVSPLNGRRTAVYTGASAQPGNLTVAQTKMTVLSDGRVVLTAFSQGRLIAGGVGQLANKVVTVPLTSGTTAVFGFDPVGGVALGQATLMGSAPAEFVLVEAQRPALVNVATRGAVGDGSQLIAGFVCVEGAKTFLIRAVGPTLGEFGVVGPQADPKLTVFSGQTALATNDDWGSASLSPTVSTAGGQVGAFQLVGGSRDAALLIRLESGSYTVVVDGKGPRGDALVEVYEIE